MTKDETIDKLWEDSNHGTRREDVEAAYDAGAAEEREQIHRAFVARFKGSGEHFFDYLHGDDEAERCVEEYWAEVMEERPNA